MRKLAFLLVISSGVVTTIAGVWIWEPWWAFRSGWNPVSFLGFFGFVVGLLQILGGVLISRRKTALGANLAICCSLVNIWGAYDVMIAVHYVAPWLRSDEVLFILGILLAMVFPALAGIVSLQLGKTTSRST